MNSFRSYKLKLPKSDSSAPQIRYDSDRRFSSSSVSSDNDDYTEIRHIGQERAQQDMIKPIPPSTKSIPLTSSFYPMSAFQAAERIAETINRSGYSFNFGTNPHSPSFTEMSELMYPHPLNYNERSRLFNPLCIPKSNVCRKQPLWNSEEHRNRFIGKNNGLRGTLNIDGVSFSGKDKPKSPDPKLEAEYVKSVKPKAVRKKSDPRIHHVGCAKSRGCFRCRYCARKFSYICHMKVHERVHTGEKPYSCDFCAHQFSQLGSLTVHMRIHTGAKPYQCGECWKKFRHVNSLRRHQRQVHNMTSEQIARSIDKVKDAVLLEKQLGAIHQSVRSPPAPVPFDFRSALDLCRLPLPWYGPNGIWNHDYKSMFVFGQNNERSDESFERVESDGNTSPVTPIEKSKPPKTWRPFEECTDDENEEDSLNHYRTEARKTSSPKNFNFEKEGIERSPMQQHAECNKTDRRTVQNSQHDEKDTLNNLDTESKEQSSDGYASMDEEVSSCSPIEKSGSKRYKTQNQCHLVC